MNMRFLETFVWVARLKSFRLTAEKLFSTQASISSRIAALEDELGVPLFLRDSKGVTLTAQGQRVLEYAEQMMDTMQAMKQSISSAGDTQGLVRIGAMDTIMHTWLSSFVARIMECYPAVEIELTADTARNLCDQLQKGYLDIIFQTDEVRADSVRNQALAQYPVQWVVSSGSIFDRTYQSLEDLTRERVITFSKHSRPHQDLLNMLHAGNIASPRVSCVNSVAAMTRLIRDGFGIGALPAALVADELRQGVLVVLADVPVPPAMDIVANWRAGVGLDLIDNVVALVHEVIADFSRSMGADMVRLAEPGTSATARESA
ncbi:LysR family transcriptional regulator [Stutzerimonas sp. VN223-3]|uniref:LysR family transcriptional regulator n=1 Tax=Stutzerimonas TaxID=2901164 RepID=UPI002108CB34|nr:LysR family transcriptional regulator [Stutzerimonas stutzeri]MCQ4313390.1 LysR family transcriptional regulator [Stutzerimonas stutzeri]